MDCLLMSSPVMVYKQGVGHRQCEIYNQEWSTIKQIMPEVIILGCIYALPAYRDLMRAEGPKHIPIY